MAEHQKDTHKPERRLSWARLLLVTGAILVLLPCLGLAGSFAYLNARRAGVFSRWRSLGALPEGGVEFVTGDTDAVYVRTAAGGLYGCEHWGTMETDKCWHEVQEPLNVDPEVEFNRRVFKDEVEPPTGTVVDTLEVAIWYAEDAFETRYVLLEDGTVWKWDYNVGAYWTLFIFTAGPLAGVALGVLVVVVLWAGVGLRSLRRRMRRNDDPPGQEAV